MDRRTPTSSVNKSKNLHRHAPKHRQSRILAAEVVAYVCVVVIVGYSAATVVVASPLNSLNVNVHQGRLRQTRIRKTSRIQEQNINHFPTTNLLGFRQRLSSPSDASEANYSYASIAGIGGFLGRQFGRNNRRFLGWALVGTTTVATIQNICSSKPVRRAAYFWWNAGPIVFHYKFTKWWLTKTNAPIEKRDAVYNNLHNRYCEQSMRIALHLKGLYVKIAQIVSSRPDFVPPVYIDLFVQCQDSLPQWPIEDIRKIIDETLRTNYNLSIDDVFESIDPIALGSASIGQVHRATIKDTAGCCYNTGTLSLPSSPVTAVKVMHPGAEDMFRHDFSVFRWLCKVALTGWTPILDECYRQIMSEFDYRTEAQSLDTVRRCLSTSPFRRSVRIPEPVHSLCTKELLVMEMLEGKKLSDSLEDELTTALGGDPDVAQTFLRRKRLELILGSENLNKLDIASNDVGSLSTRSKIRLLRLYRRASKIIDLLVNVQGYSILSSGIFNGDPHPGNVLVMPDGKLGLVDFGQVKHISTDERIGVAKVVNDLNAGSTKDVANSMRALGFETEKDDDTILVQYAKLFFDSDSDGKQIWNCPTPQSYFKKLTEADPLTNVPDVAIFVARSSFILRGMGTLLDKQIETANAWGKYAKAALSSEK